MPDNILAYSPTLALIESHVAIYKIYILRNPIDGKIFYVGQTMQSLDTRLSGHISETGGSNRGKIKYIKEILESGNKPLIEPIETIATTCYIDKMAVNEREIYWIRYHKSLGCELLNISATAPHTKCNEYHGYLSAIKKGETSWHYYYCGKVVMEKIKKYNMNITISKEDHYTANKIKYPMEGILIKIKQKKRYYAKVLGISTGFYEHTLRCKIVYKPSTKSTLQNKSIFSKVKMPIINH